MLRKIVAVVCLLALSGSAMAVEPGIETRSGTSVRVAGQLGKTGYRLEVEYSPEAAAPKLAGLVVRAEPSGEALASFWSLDFDTSALRPKTGNPSRVEIETLFEEVRANAMFEFVPGINERISVTAFFPDGQSRLLFNAAVDLSSFDVSTIFEFDSNRVPGGYRHTCRCMPDPNECGTMSIRCPDAYFSCNCTNCSIECGW